MVHALEIIKDLLKPGGLLVDIHPSGKPPPFELLSGGERTFLGYLQETDNFIEYAQADAALLQAVANGWFSLESQALFTFCTCAQSVAELWEFISNTWSDAILPDEHAARRIIELSSQPGTSDQQLVTLTEHVRLTLLHASPRR